MPSPTRSPSWKALQNHYSSLQNFQLREAFASNPRRFNELSIQFNDILFDFSKNLITPTTLDLLVELAIDSNLTEKTEAMFTGQKINHTEQRAVLHTALRNRSNHPVYVDNQDVMPKINAVLNRCGISPKKSEAGNGWDIPANELPMWLT
jgi:glucose-6-phosphate isomerase